MPELSLRGSDLRKLPPVDGAICASAAGDPIRRPQR